MLTKFTYSFEGTPSTPKSCICTHSNHQSLPPKLLINDPPSSSQPPLENVNRVPSTRDLRSQNHQAYIHTSMAKFFSSSSSSPSLSVAAEKVSWYSALLLAMLLVLSCCELADEGESSAWRRAAASRRPCDEIYVVEEGETLQTISEKCGDPFIVEENPHIQDPDDVFPGLVIKITPFGAR
ncbi:hypothetical protein ACLOJK_031304 [Asimina triloba]